MKVVFWVSFFILFYGYVGYPILLLMVSWRCRKEKDNWTPFTPSVSIIVPVYNEERVIGRKIENTLALDYPCDRLEFIIVSDGSTDRTHEIVKSRQDRRIKYLALPNRMGKAAALNKGLEHAQGEIVVFSDASIMLDRMALANLVRRFQIQEIGCVSGEDHVCEDGGDRNYGRYELFLRSLESRMGSIVGASGSFYAQRRRLCPPFQQGMAPDFFSVLETVRRGFRAVTEPEAAGVMQSVKDDTVEFRRRVRTLLRGITTLWHFKYLLNPFEYGFFSIKLISHKLIRWLAGLFLIMMLFSNLFLIAPNIYGLSLILQFLFYSLALLGWVRISKQPPFRIPFYFTMLNVSALVAWYKYFSGFRQEIWEPSHR